MAYRAVVGPVSMTATAEVKPQVLRVQAVAYVARLVKRERPVVTGAWRMCPSI